MLKHHQIFLASSAVILGMSFSMSSALAAKPVNLKFQSASVLQSFNNVNQIGLKEVNATTDFTQVTNVRMKQTYAGYPVWGGDVIVHIPQSDKTSLHDVMANSKGTVSGVMYQDLDKDLQKTPALVFTAGQASKALEQAIHMYQKKSGIKAPATEAKSDLMVYVDKNNHARWAFLVSFLIETQKSVPAMPTYIMDAETLNVYGEWNNIQTEQDAFGGGFGGNKKAGKWSYDGIGENLPKLNIKRAALKRTCYFQNSDVTVKDLRTNVLGPAQYQCAFPNVLHNFVFWNGASDAVNGAYSPNNDALFAGRVIQDMYKKWYSVPALLDQAGKPLMLTMNVHISNYQNAFFSPATMQMYFGDGADVLYPLVSLGVGAHEISHGFTEQHSKLVYSEQSGGLNEAYSDMAAQAAEFYAYGSNSWEIGSEIFKANRSLRYMDEPTKDCQGSTPGDNCSISHMKDYNDSIDVHYTSGIFNKAFYLLGTSEGWDTKKAFDVMVKANMAYWRPNVDFNNAANCVLKAAEDLNYDGQAVVDAFAKVGVTGINVDNCY